MSIVSSVALAEIDALQARYIHALDNRDLRQWAGTFISEESAAYFCISAENEESHLPVALMYDDSRDRIEDRIVFIERIWTGTFQDYRTRHFVQRTDCRQLEQGLFAAETNFSIIYTPESGRTGVQVAGVYKDLISIGSDGARFRSKRAIYDTTILPRYIVYPF